MSDLMLGHLAVLNHNAQKEPPPSSLPANFVGAVWLLIELIDVEVDVMNPEIDRERNGLHATLKHLAAVEEGKKRRKKEKEKKSE